ncbi:hypothetical protein GCM10023165_45810 [Variovorax defluvii]|uniref:Uncharacterized protein n=1 Tax=Variovorax defluvii TaxID=913761 RepID=A0ABP8IAB4_9BURK
MTASHASTEWELRFEPLFLCRRGYVFPCNAQGQVDMDALSGPTLNNYLYARAMMGRELAWPCVQACTVH